MRAYLPPCNAAPPKLVAFAVKLNIQHIANLFKKLFYVGVCLRRRETLLNVYFYILYMCVALNFKMFKATFSFLCMYYTRL